MIVIIEQFNHKTKVVAYKFRKRLSEVKKRLAF
jgi:hypothetical protein